MADQKLTELSTVSSASGTDLVYLVVDTAGTPTSKGITVSNIFKSETDRVVGAVNGIVKGDGAGNISAATPDTDYLTSSTASTTYLTTSAAASTYEPLKGIDDNYVTDAQLIVIGNTSGTNTGDQFTNISTSKILGRGSAGGAGAAQEITLGTNLSMVGTTLNVTGAGSGTVTDLSVVNDNGFAGTVANSTSTPAITLFTTESGVLKGESSTLTAAIDGTDFLSPAYGVTTSQATPQTIGSTGNRLSHLWATDITVTNAITGSVTTSGVSTSVAISSESADTTCFPLFVTASSGNLPAKINTGYTYNSSTNTLTLGDINGVLVGYSTQNVRFHGIESSGTLSFNDSTHVVTLAAGTNTYYYKANKYTTTSAITCDLDDYVTLTANTLYYVSFSDATGTLRASTSPWSFTENVFVCTIYWNGSVGACQDERHSHDRNIPLHIWAHDTIGCRYEPNGGLGLTKPTTADDASLQIESGNIHDEDIDKAITQQTIMRGWYQSTSNVYTFTDYSLPYLGTSGQPKYLRTSDYTLQNVGASNFACYWVYASLDIGRPIYVIPTQAASDYNTIALARSETPPSLTGLAFNAEIKLIYKFIYKGDGNFQESADYRTASVLPGGGITTIAASGVTFVPTGNISATDVQSALAEVDTEKAPLASPSFTGTVTASTFAGNATTASTSSVSTTITVAAESADTSCSILFSTDATGNIAPKSNAGLTFNSATAAVTATTFIGALTGNASGSSGSCTGNSVTASTSTVATTIVANHNVASTTCYPAFLTATTGSLPVQVSSSLSFNAATNALTSTLFVGMRKPSVYSTTYSATTTPNVDLYDVIDLTAVSSTLVWANPSGTPYNEQKLMLKWIDNGTSRAMSFGTSYAASSTVALPSSTVAGKTGRLMVIYNSDNSLNKWQAWAYGVGA